MRAIAALPRRLDEAENKGEKEGGHPGGARVAPEPQDPEAAVGGAGGAGSGVSHATAATADRLLPTRSKALSFGACGHLAARVTEGDRVELLDVATGRDVNRAGRLCAEHALFAGDALLLLNWDDADVR